MILDNSIILQEWEVTLKCNYKCFYCKLPKIKEVTNKKILKEFMDNLDKNIELFLFGGEPFLHSEIKFIIDYLNQIKQPFVIQSNLSSQSINIIKNKKLNNFILQGSIHPTEISKEKLIINLKFLKELIKENKIILRRIDIMYTGEKSLLYYKIVNSIFKNYGIVYLIPISGFYENESCKYTKEYNKLKNKFKDSKEIKFEDNYIKSLNKFRSEVWEDQCNNKFNTFGKQCPYNYILYAPDLSKYNCCYRENTNGICNHRRCFWM